MRLDPFADEMERLGPSDWDERAPSRPNGQSEPWDQPDLTFLGSGQRPAPAFPVASLGGWADWTEETARGASAPTDYVAVALLACVGAAIGNVRWPIAGRQWAEPPVLNLAEVGKPSSGKSPGMDAAFALMRHAEELMAQNFDGVLAEHALQKQAAEARQEAWRADVKGAVKAGEDPPPLPPDAVEPTMPVRPRIRVGDATMEKLAALAAGLPRGLLLVRDELAGFLGGLDRYSGGKSDRAFVLECYGGRSFIMDRVKSPEPITIRHLSVGVLGGIQPERLSGLIDGPDDGLTARFLWSWPDAVPEFRLGREVRDDTAMQVAFARLTGLAMGSDAFGHLEPKLLPLTRSAEDALEAFARDMARLSNEHSGLYAGTLGKARGHALRLACVIDHLWWCARPQEAEPERIDLPAMRAAIEMMEGYFLPMAERVFGDASIPVAERRAMHLARHLRRTGLTAFNARDLRREIGGLLRDAEHMNDACAHLVEANLIRARPHRSGATKGRNAQAYEVNPAVYGRLS